LYWREHPHKGKYLPPIAIRGFPWEVFPGEVYVLDLGEDLLVQALRQSPFELFDQRVKIPVGPPGERMPEALTPGFLGMILGVIQFDGVVAWTTSLVQVAVFELLKTAHHSPHLRERRQAVAWLGKIFDAFFPDLSQHVSRREETLLPLLTNYENLHASVRPLQNDLRREGPARALLARFRDRLQDARIGLSDLRRWKSLGSRAVTLELLSRRVKTSPRTLGDLLVLAGKARATQEAWDGFRRFWDVRPESARLAVLPSISPYMPFTIPAPSHPSSPQSAPPQSS
jgi:hypothetical protein